VPRASLYEVLTSLYTLSRTTGKPIYTLGDVMRYHKVVLATPSLHLPELVVRAARLGGRVWSDFKKRQHLLRRYVEALATVSDERQVARSLWWDLYGEKYPVPVSINRNYSVTLFYICDEPLREEFIPRADMIGEVLSAVIDADVVQGTVTVLDETMHVGTEGALRVLHRTRPRLLAELIATRIEETLRGRGIPCSVYYRYHDTINIGLTVRVPVKPVFGTPSEIDIEVDVDTYMNPLVRAHPVYKPPIITPHSQSGVQSSTVSSIDEIVEMVSAVVEKAVDTLHRTPQDVVTFLQLAEKYKYDVSSGKAVKTVPSPFGDITISISREVEKSPLGEQETVYVVSVELPPALTDFGSVGTIIESHYGIDFGGGIGSVKVRGETPVASAKKAFKVAEEIADCVSRVVELYTQHSWCEGRETAKLEEKEVVEN